MGILSNYVKSILAGIMISLGGTVFLSIESKYLGSFLFAIGLFMIFSYSLNLFTGKIGYLVTKGGPKPLELLIVWLGNFTGTAFCGFILNYTRVAPTIVSKAENLCIIKLSDNLLSIFILSCFCGLCMFIAADNYKNGTNSVQKYLATFLPVMVFILSGFEHCVANMFYFALSNTWSLKMLLYLLVMTLGNSIGGFAVPLLKKLTK